MTSTALVRSAGSAERTLAVVERNLSLVTTVPEVKVLRDQAGAIRHLVAEVGAGQLVVGTDYPYPWTRTAVDEILATPGLSDAERRAILGGTAAGLLGIKA